jgi:pimeloyl-ACP methyl ester carboxylesterase
MWDEQVNYFKNKYRVITYDIRGLGYSNDLSDYLFTMEEHVNDFFDILDHLKLEKVNACGLSMGGYILLRALIRDQDRFASVILADTKSENDDSIGILNRSNSIIKIKSGGKDEFLDDFLRKLLSEDGYRNRKVRDFVKMIMSWMDVKGLAANMLAIATRTNIFYRLKEINTPALVIVGKKDELTPVYNSFNLKEGLKNSKFKVIDGAGHLSNLEKPDVFNKSTEEFLINIKS